MASGSLRSDEENRHASAARPADPSRRGQWRWIAFLDGATDGLVVSFAIWTLFYQFALGLQFSMLWAGWPWILLSGLVMVVCGRRRMQARSVLARRALSPPMPAPMGGWIALYGLLAALVVLTLVRGVIGVWPLALLAIAALILQLAPWLRVGAVSPSPPEPETSPGSHVFALTVSLGLGILGSFLLRPDDDDVFYVNRATWVATHGTAALNDTMFGPDVLPPAYAGGIPTPSIEAAEGVLAHAFGMQAPTLCYLFAVPVLGVVAGWTTWRLIRAWAPRRAWLAMGTAVLFLLASADCVIGNYSLGRIWQGKAIAYAILLPLVWLLLSRTVSQIRRWDLVMLLSAGIAFGGLTTTSALLAPVVVGAALLAALILRSTSLALGAAAFAVGPLINGLVQVLGPATISGGGDNATSTAPAAFAIALGISTPMVLLGLISLVLVPRLTMGSVGVLLGCGAVASLAGLLPGIFAAADALTGAGAVAWRLVIGMPTWILVGLLVTIPGRGVTVPRAPSRVGRFLPWAVIAATIAIPVIWGSWLWSVEGASLTSRPTWKVDQSALKDVRAALRSGARDGTWLLPPSQMEILAISRVGPFAVVPRGYYLPTLQVPAPEFGDRAVLFHLVLGEPMPVERVRLALDRLDVPIACVPAEDAVSRKILEQAVDADLTEVGQMRCYIKGA